MAGTEPVKLAFKIVEPSTKKDKCDIIFIHGITFTKADFDTIASRIANETGRRVYMVDVRNHGDSERSEVFTIDAIVSDVVRFMNEHKIKTVSIVGHSLGGRTAMALALKHSHLIESIVVEDMTPKGLPQVLMDGYWEYIRLLHESIKHVPNEVDLETAQKIVFEYVFSNKPPLVMKNANITGEIPFLAALIQRDGKYTWKTNLPVILKYKSNSQFLEDMQGLYDKRVLFLYGTHSELNVGQDKDFILKLFPKTQFHEFSTSHLVHAEAPVEFVQAVAKFLQ